MSAMAEKPRGTKKRKSDMVIRRVKDEQVDGADFVSSARVEDFVRSEPVDSPIPNDSEAVVSAEKSHAAAPSRNDNNEAFFALSPKRRLTVRAWKNKTLIDIREVSD